MRVLITHRWRVPEPTGSANAPAPGAPTPGAALRAWHHAEALRAAGHDVRLLTREADEPGGFRSPAHLRRLAREHAPDWILAVAPEDAPALRGLAPLVVDLYAPRVLEAAFEGTQSEEAVRALQAVHAADEVLFSNPRQRWYWLGVLGIAGWDLSRAAGLIIPLAAHGLARKKPRRPRVIVGGYPWPWAQGNESLARALNHLGKRADVVSYGLPLMAGVESRGLVSLAEWREACSTATVALDRYAHNPERELAASFRQADYLGGGLPMITDPWTVLADEVRAYRAGWVDEPLEDALDAALQEDRGDGARALGKRYARETTEAPLLAWTPSVRERIASATVRAVDLARARERTATNQLRAEAAHEEVRRKREEVAALHEQVARLTGALSRLSEAMADVAGFRRETVAVLGTRLAGQTGEAEELRRQLEITRADLDKKTLELAAVQADRSRLDGVLARLRPTRS